MIKSHSEYIYALGLLTSFKTSRTQLIEMGTPPEAIDAGDKQIQNLQLEIAEWEKGGGSQTFDARLGNEPLIKSSNTCGSTCPCGRFDE